MERGGDVERERGREGEVSKRESLNRHDPLQNHLACSPNVILER